MVLFLYCLMHLECFWRRKCGGLKRWGLKAADEWIRFGLTFQRPMQLLPLKELLTLHWAFKSVFARRITLNYWEVRGVSFKKGRISPQKIKQNPSTKTKKQKRSGSAGLHVLLKSFSHPRLQEDSTFITGDLFDALFVCFQCF